jgi:hypothetical protein
MLRFKSFLLSEASIRQGLPHISTMSHDQFHNLTKGGKVHIDDVTEKTDGQTMVIGHDEHGFYTQSSGSGNEKMRNSTDYAARAKRRSEETGKEYNSAASDAFGDVHKNLQNNQALQNHLKSQYHKTGQEVKVRGESFYKPWGRPSEVPGEVKFVGTSYDPSHMAKVGKIVIHSRLPENQGHDLEHFKNNLSDENINFDDDRIEHKPSHIDVSHERTDFDKLNHDLINSRTTKSNKQAKEAEVGKFAAIKQRAAEKVDAHMKSQNIKPKWGSGTEGAVIHPSINNPDAPRFKVTSDAFRAYKQSDESKNLLKR